MVHISDTLNFVKIARFNGCFVVAVSVHQDFRLFHNCIRYPDFEVVEIAVNFSAVNEPLQAFRAIFRTKIQMIADMVSVELPMLFLILILNQQLEIKETLWYNKKG